MIYTNRSRSLSNGYSADWRLVCLARLTRGGRQCDVILSARAGTTLVAAHNSARHDRGGASAGVRRQQGGCLRSECSGSGTRTENAISNPLFPRRFPEKRSKGPLGRGQPRPAGRSALPRGSRQRCPRPARAANNSTPGHRPALLHCRTAGSWSWRQAGGMLEARPQCRFVIVFIREPSGATPRPSLAPPRVP